MAESLGGVIVTVALAADVPALAVTFTDRANATAVVTHGKLAAVPPAGTVTEPGQAHELELEVKVTSSPPAGAGEARTMAPVVELPPTTELGLSLKDANFGASTVRVALAELVPNEALIVTVVMLETGEVET